MDSLIQDLRRAVRQLAKNPGFTLVAVITLALGIGANTAVFSLANWVVLRPVPGVRDGNDLVAVGFRTNRGYQRLSYPTVLDFAAGVTALSSFSGEMSAWQLPVSAEGAAPRLQRIQFVTGNYFDALRVTALKGRMLALSDEKPGQPPAAVLSYSLWRDLVHSDPGAIGKSIRVNQTWVTIAGIAPEGFQGSDRLTRTELWMLASTLGLVTGEARFNPLTNRRGGLFVETFGRFVPGVTIELVEAQLRTVARQIGAANPETDNRDDAEIVVRPGIGVPMAAREKASAVMRLLVGIAGVVLIIAAANFANLLLFRGVRRRGETAVRLALGASRVRLIRESVVESVLLALVAGAAALTLAVWLVSFFRGATFAGLAPIDSVQLDGRVLLFGLISALALGIAVGLVSPLSLGRTALSAVLKDAASKGSGRRAYLRSGMVVVQLSASLTLLVGAVLLITTLRNLRAVDVGFDAAHTHVFALNPGRAGYSGERGTALLNDLRTRVAGLPGIDRVSLAYTAPFSSFSMGNRAKSSFLPPDGRGVPVTDVWVSPGYFATLGIPLIRGRDFSEMEFQPGAAAPADVVVVSTSASRQLFGDQDPVGQQITSLRSNGRALVDQPFRIVGVVGDTKWESLVGFDGAGAILYHVLGEGPTGAGQAPGVTVMVHSELPARRLRPLVESTITQVAPGIPLSEVSSLSERIEGTIAEQRLFAQTITMLTLLAVGLAGVGLYGLVGFAVAERTREFGIRIALGAQHQQVLNMVIHEGAFLAVFGVGLGLVGAVVLSRLIASRLYGVTPLEPFVYIMSISLLVLITLLASFVPARAATKVDPMVALRSE